MLFPLPELHTPILPMTPMPRRAPNLIFAQHNPSPIHDHQQSTSCSNPQKKKKVIEFATKAKEKYQRNNPKISFRELERKKYKDLKTSFTIYTVNQLLKFQINAQLH